MKRLVVAAVVLMLVVLLAGAWVLRARSATSRALPSVLARGPERPRAPEGVRIRVQVLNTTRTRGLARRATRVLRDQGFDVVEIGTAAGPALDTTLVLARSGHLDWARTVAQVLGPARAEARADSSRYLDVTVLLGRSWRPPATETLDP